MPRIILTDNQIREYQLVAAPHIRLIKPNYDLDIPGKGYRPLGKYNGNNGVFACFQEKTVENVKDHVLGIINYKNSIDFCLKKKDGRKLETLANINGILDNHQFSIQYPTQSEGILTDTESKILKSDFANLASLYCAAEKYLKDKLKIEIIILPPPRLWCALLEEGENKNPQFKDKYDHMKRIKRKGQFISSVYNQYLMLGFGTRDDAVKGEAMTAGKNIHNMDLESFVKILKQEAAAQKRLEDIPARYHQDTSHYERRPIAF